jgi:hypothetical protein
MRYFCRTEKRRNEVRKVAGLNGIDYLEVDPSQTKLTVTFLKADGVAALGANNLRVEGGERIRGVQVVGPPSASGNVLTVTLDRRGDFSRYTLLLTRDPTTRDPPSGFDPLLAAIGFSFKAGCDSDFDCREEAACPPARADEPVIDYLAKDYASFRQLMLDRLTLLLPQWGERNPADLGVTLVEMLAYVGDQLSYWQDAVATEAYLGTARRRISVRRHARLVDYAMHDGCNARAWAQIRVNANGVKLNAGTQLLTQVVGLPERITPGSAAALEASRASPATFETLRDAVLYAPHNRMDFYTWGEAECCLPRGATRATLLDGQQPVKRLHLQAGDVLLLGETKSGGTDEVPALARCAAVRLTSVRPAASDPPRLDPVTSTAVVEIEWHPEDALPFALTVSGRPGSQGVALGNIALAQHAEEVVEPIRCDRTVRFRPALRYPPLTQGAPDPYLGEDPADPLTLRSAAAALRWGLADVQPLIRLEEGAGANPPRWEPRRDLLGSGPADRHFVAEIDDGGTARLRFGDNQLGLRPEVGSELVARYRIGNGMGGNLGADALVHVLHADPAVLGVRNPLPAAGGVDPESLEEVRVRAPSAFRTQQRAVTADDYARMAERHPLVKRAAASLRWTGSWFTAFVTVEPRGTPDVSAALEADLRRHLERYRLAGHDLEIDGPRYVPLDLALDVCVRPDYFRASVRTRLLETLGSRRLADGRLGLFHPDHFAFGEAVYLSPVVTAALGVPGVHEVRVTSFRRQRQPDDAPLREGKIAIGRLEIAQLANDPSFPERGLLRLNLMGGK